MDIPQNISAILKKHRYASIQFAWSELECYQKRLEGIMEGIANPDRDAVSANEQGAIRATVVGYRYGRAPESGVSWNHAENKPEPGISMAQVLTMPENTGFATLSYRTCQRFYYEGQVAGYGSDDEITISDAREITFAEYKKRKGQYPEIMEKLLRKHLDVSWLATYSGLDFAKNFLAHRLDKLPAKLRKQADILIAERKTGLLQYPWKTKEELLEYLKKQLGETSTLFEDLKAVSYPHRPDQANELLQMTQKSIASGYDIIEAQDSVETN